MKKKSILLIIGLLVITLLAGCTKAKPTGEATIAEGDVEGDVTVLTIGATPVPHMEILEFIQPILLEEGIQLNITEFTDYVTPNLALADGEIDANFFQHVPYMETFATNNNLQLSAVAKVHVEPLGLYSKKLAAFEDLEEGATISIPNDPTNGGRALLLLEYYGLIELAEDAGLEATEKDIASNPKNLKFVALEAPLLPRSLDDVAASVINTNYALETGFNPVKDSLIIEDANSPYANVLTIRPEDQNNEAILALVDVLNSPEVKAFLETKYEGAIVPAF
ncbi:MetQ/NlpA family ABC transporter substrate-binding protein [Clostridium formicaceticum]|uniref:Lipoprotein n=1 Tax=Clostridium formicaceticum TaxID=1497 RepID=A0AAC9WET0_9CLOT|nr:MetQ/NlpA family ABC transporter substrate-binding protein [Clostridium formicaceticum]AOY75771.1 methionine ABC transporter substrate-binding protein [Clostridium formicaceticum]ARE86097.1 D-methionine-binding lipoprotein MetQ precursor [Clostridium formicaceticum]